MSDGVGLPPAVVIDTDVPRRGRIEALLRAVGLDVMAEGCKGALVLFSVDVPNPEDGVRRWTARGAHVIAFAESAAAWPITRRCRVLLAGARELVDAASGSITEAVHRVVADAQRRLAAERVVHEALSTVGAVAVSAAMLEIFSSVVQVSVLSDLPTLITGETGTGKQLIAEALHRLDPRRRSGPFVAVNCGAITSSLVEAELFGHRRGAFTGAERDRKGLVRAADGGVLFLDELGELDAGVQVKLLRVLQEQRVLAVGDERESPVNVRVIAATNRDLRAAVRAGTFREDLFQRLNVIALHVPPLRDRREDIAPLVRHFLHKHRAISGGVELEAGADFLEALSMLELPGNARQIENLVRNALVHATTGTLSLRDLPRDVWSHLCESPTSTAGPLATVHAFAGTMLDAHPGDLESALNACERALVREAYERSHHNQARTARLLGVTPRCVYSKLRKHRLTA